MCADRVAFLIDATHGGWESARHFADQEIGHLHTLRRKDVEDLVSMRKDRPVIKGEDHFLVIERQRVGILHLADARKLGGIDRQHAARPNCVRMSGTDFSRCGRLLGRWCSRLR